MLCLKQLYSIITMIWIHQMKKGERNVNRFRNLANHIPVYVPSVILILCVLLSLLLSKGRGLSLSLSLCVSLFFSRTLFCDNAFGSGTRHKIVGPVSGLG